MNRVLASTSLRLALGYAGLFIASSLLLVGVLWWRTAAYLDREINAVVIADTNAIGDRLRDFGLSGAIDSIKERVGKSVDLNAIYLLTDPALRPIAGNLAAWPLDVGRTPGWYQVDLVHAGDLHATRLLNVSLSGDFHLLVGRDVQDRAAIGGLVVEGLGWAAAAAVLLATAGGLLVRRSVLRRVDSINRTALAIVRGDLARRVPTGNTTDEFDQLAQTINGMLQQIQLLIEGISHASDIVAHDLRTPLAELRVRLETLLASRPPPETIFFEVQGAVADIDRVISIFNALLRLAEIDSGVRRAGFRTVDLAMVVSEVAEQYALLTEDKALSLVVDLAAVPTVTGDPFLLAQAVGNLVDNAVKYARPGGLISVELRQEDSTDVQIIVADDGPGIADGDKERVTDRFYRGDNVKGTEGVGLGLALVAAVARLHGGCLILSDNHPGLKARLAIAVGNKSV